MTTEKTDSVSRRAYEKWEAEGRPEGRHEHHWHEAEKELEGQEPQPGAKVPYPGMMGDGTEEQNLDQPGDPKARVTQDDVENAFGGPKAPKSSGN